MKSKSRLIRLVVYLVISVGLIIILLKIRQTENTSKRNLLHSKEELNDEARYAIENDHSFQKFYYLNSVMDSMAYYQYGMPLKKGIPVDLPENSDDIGPIPRIKIEIDSNNIYYLNELKIEWDELADSITVQHTKKPKLSILLSVDKRAKSGHVTKILELAKEKKMKVGIETFKN